MKNRIPKEEWTSLYAGHEVAIHTVTHPTIARCPSPEIFHEIYDDKMEIEKVFGYPVRGIAYPNGSCDDRCVDIARNAGIVYGRIAADKYSTVCSAETNAKFAEAPILLGDENGFGMPDDYMRWLPTCHHNHHLKEFGKKFMSLKKKQYLYMMYVWGHSYEFGRDNNWDVMERFCEMTGNRDDIWYATNIEYVNYMEAAKRLIYAYDSSFVYNPNAVSVWITINNNTVVEIPGGSQIELTQYA